MTFRPAAAAPTFGPAPGSYKSAQTLTISDTTPNSTVYYTTDGSTPSSGSAPYTGPISIATSQTVSAFAAAPGYADSPVTSATYTIEKRPTITWATPEPLTYGSPLSATQLNATADVPGTFAYSPVVGTVLPAGSNTLSVTFTPTDTANLQSTTAQATLTVNQATPSITWPTPSPINYGTALSATQLNASASVPGTFVYSPATGIVPPLGSNTLSVTFTPTDRANYTTASASVTLVVNAANPVPDITSISPALASAGNAGFTLTVNGSAFQSSSVVKWGSSDLSTQFVSSTRLTAQVPASSIATAGTATITVQTPAPGGGVSSSLVFEVDSASSGPVFASTTATVTAGATATYSVTLPSTATNVSVTCLNLQPGATCSYSSATGKVTIATSATTPKGTYQITVVFTETLPGAAAAAIIAPFLLLPLLYFRRKFGRTLLVTAVMALVLAGAMLSMSACGGGSSHTGPPVNPTHQVTSSGVVDLTIQ